MSGLGIKLRSWGNAARRVILGPNRAVLSWVDLARIAYVLNPSEYDVLLVIATWTRHKTWDGSRLCIAWVVERTQWSRATVKRAISKLRQLGLLLQDGEITVSRGRPVVRYRLGGTPECGLPEEVWEARDAEETAGQHRNEPYTLQTVGSASSYRSLHTENLSPSGGDISLSSAEQKVTDSIPQPMDDARRPSYVRPGVMNPAPRTEGDGTRGRVTRVARKLAEALLASRRPPCPRKTGEGFSVAPVAFASGMEGAFQPSEVEVTYCTPTSEGASVTPFTDPTLGALPRDARYFYLGLRNLMDAAGQVAADPRYLKSQLFPYDDDVTAEVVSDMTEILVLSGKAHEIPGHLVLSDVPAVPLGKEIALFDLPPKAPSDPLAAFEEFWKVWPRRQGKGAARKAFISAVAKGVDAAFIIASATAYAHRCQLIGKESQFIPHPSTWLNQERYDDDAEAAPQVRSRMDDAFRQNMELTAHYQQQEIGNTQKEIGW